MPAAEDRALALSYAVCEHLARTHYENFPVASRLLPRRLRPHVAAVYAFARTADDIADEPGREPAERLRLLAAWRDRLHARPAVPDTEPFLPALHDTIDRFDLPVSLFEDLLSAFAQDVETTRYETWTDVLDYCRRSANPVGRIVLRLSGYHDARLDAASDAVCTALQLTNFWQDLAIDWSRGRLYVPTEEWRAHGADPRALAEAQWTPAWRETLRASIARTRGLLQEGRPVCDGTRGRLRLELRATWLGGSRILDRLEQSGPDPFRHRPSLGVRDGVVIACKALAWTRPR